MYNFCTLFNSFYLVKGLAMQRSLLQRSPGSHLYILAMDDFTRQYLLDAELVNVTVIALKNFENEELLAVKKKRTVAEYCWTCSSSLISYCIETYHLPSCTYVDADIYFYQDPGILLSELTQNKAQVLITEHGFDEEHKHLEAYGRFCIQFLCFTNHPEAKKILNTWKEECIDWCYSWAEKGRFGDQKYLDDWPERYDAVHILGNTGALAPWNISRFNVIEDGNKNFMVREKKTNISVPLVLYHFHDLKFYKNNTLCLVNGYDVSEVTGSLYYPYMSLLARIEKSITDKYSSFQPEKMLPEFINDTFLRSMRARFQVIMRKQKIKRSQKRSRASQN